MEPWMLTARIRWILASEDDRSHQVYRLRQLAHEHAVDTALEVLGMERKDLELFERDGNP